MESRGDAWWKRRMMRLTTIEKRAVNSPEHARRTVEIGLSLLEHVSLPDRPICLELGCGQGALARLLVERLNARMTATDLDPTQVDLAVARLKDLGEHISLRVVDARELPFADGTFDGVFSFGVMHHIPGGWRRVIADVARVLTPEGRFIFTDYYVARWLAAPLNRLFPSSEQLMYEPLREALAERGFGITYHTWERQAGGLLTYGKTIASKAAGGRRTSKHETR